MDAQETFWYWINARERTRIEKESGSPAPWTADAILQKYRFCNVHREDDRVTRWIAKNWRQPLAALDSRNIWFWMLVARLVNHPPTLAALGSPVLKEWDSAEFQSVISDLQAKGCKVWGGAYIVSTNGRRMPKPQYIAEHVLDPAWYSDGVAPVLGDSLSTFCDRLLALNGVKGFIAGQVIADAKYADNHLKGAADWYSFAISGPGSRRGLNRYHGRALKAPWKEANWHAAVGELLDEAWNVHKIDIHAQDLQNCLCEYDKYMRVRNREGRPRSLYKPQGESN